MGLLIGQPVTGRDIEQLTSAWSPERFASMCDALTWAVSGRQFPGLPSFTTRVNAKDGGIDAEWWAEIPDDNRHVPTPIVGPGWNVFQYKKRDLIAQDRRRVISNLKTSLIGAVAQLVQDEKDGRHPNRYVLFVNVDLKHNDKSALRESILKGYHDQTRLHIEIIGAAEIAAFLNNHPHLRAAYFAPLSFKTWEEAHRTHLDQKLIGSVANFAGREAEHTRLKALADDPRVRAIVLSGPHDIGKTRSALEATRHRPHDVVLALDPRSMTLGDYRSLCASRGEAICIVEEPEPDSLEALLNETLTTTNLKLIITLPTSTNVPEPSYGRDERVQSLHLRSLTEESARQLLKATGQPLDFEVEDWIIRHAGGIPGILLAAASFGHVIRQDMANFVEAVGREFEKQIQSMLGADALKCARLFSILTHVGISGAFEDELTYICDLFGDGWTPHQALLSFVDLERVGLGRRGGSFAEITLPILANHLTAQMLRGRRDEMVVLFGRLDDAGRKRFIKRLSEVRSEEVIRFWDDVFVTDSLLPNFQAALSNLHLLRLVAGVAPKRVLHLLESGLQKSSREERLAIRGDQRRDLVWALEQLLFRTATSLGAMRLMWLLAEAENENYGNNARGIFAECFHPLHPQIPLSLQSRLALLSEFTSENISKEGKLVAIQAIQTAMKQTGSFHMRYGTGLELLDSRPTYTYLDLYDYRRDLVDLLFSLSIGEDEITVTALSELPRLIAKLGIQAMPQDALKRFKILVQWVLSGKDGLDVSALVDALCWMRNFLSERLDRPEFPSDHRDEFLEYLAELNQLKTVLEAGNFSIRLRRWAGREVLGDHEDDLEAGEGYGFQRELKKLASEAVEKPDLLDADLLVWLLSPSSQRSHIFFFWLGHDDGMLIFRERIESLAQRFNGAPAFAAYWGGWAARDLEAAEHRLDQLATSNAATAEALVQATAWLGGNQAAIVRMIKQIEARRVHPEYVARELRVGGFLKPLTEDQVLQLLTAIAGVTFEHGASAVDILRTWILFEKPLQGKLADFAWRCLEQAPPVEPSTFDLLAAELAKDDPERGFGLLEKLIERNEEADNYWDPLDPYDGKRFWRALYSIDRKRLVGLLLNKARTNVRIRFHLCWQLKELLNQGQDKDLLLSFAKDHIEYARVVASCVTSAKTGFWPIAFELTKRYPNDEELLSNLTSGLEQQGATTIGPSSLFYGGLKQEIEQVIHEPSTPPEVRTWLHEVMSRLEGEISQQIIWEYDEDVNDLRRYIQDKTSSQRLWAIGRVLKYAKWEDVKRLLTVEDIEQALPLIDLPEKKRKMLERATEVWRYGK
jgi:hypothetical protein